MVWLATRAVGFQPRRQLQSAKAKKENAKCDMRNAMRRGRARIARGKFNEMRNAKYEMRNANCETIARYEFSISFVYTQLRHCMTSLISLFFTARSYYYLLPSTRI